MRGNTVRKQVFVYAGIALVVVAAAVIWIVVSQSPTGRLFEDDQRANVLLIGRDDAGATEMMALLSVSEADVVLFSLPPTVRLHDASGAFDSVAGMVAAAGPGAAASAVGTLLALDIPYYWACDLNVLRGWLDARAGLAITLGSTAVYLDDRTDPALRVEVRSGTQTYNGADALAFATAPAIEGNLGRLDRQDAFLEALAVDAVAGTDARALHNAIRSDDAEWGTNLSVAEMIQIADAVHSVPADDVRADHLIGEEADIDGVTYTQPNVVETEHLVAALLKGLTLLTPADVNVAVFNGNLVREVARRTADYLLARGFQVTGVRNADTFDYETSYMLVLTEESKAWVLRDALPDDADVRIVFPETFASRYDALRNYIPAGTDVVFIAGAGWEME